MMRPTDAPETPEGLSPPHRPALTLSDIDGVSAARILAATGDVTLVIDRDGVITDLAVGGADGRDGVQADLSIWRNRRWIDTVSNESRPKVTQMLDDAAEGRPPRWRQVNQLVTGDGDGGQAEIFDGETRAQLPIRYLAVEAGADGRVVAVGRDMRATAVLQGRLLAAQQSMERDYVHLRQTESRYRLLFDVSGEAVVIVEAATRRITDANPAAARLFGRQESTLVGQPLVSLVHPDDREQALTMLGAVSRADQEAPVQMRIAHDGKRHAFRAALFRQDRGTFILLRILAAGVETDASTNSHALLDILERMPDAFVLTNARLEILSENAAFLDLTHSARREQVRGVSIADFLGRPGIDLNLLVGQLREHGFVRNFATVVRGQRDEEEDVELSAVSVPGEDGPHFGFSIRSVARRVQESLAPARNLPRSVEQLTGLVGRVSLKEIVRESTDLIERLCIEAALNFTSNNRASAAEILGLSRQSLYSKLHRHGLGNLATEMD